MFSFKTGLLLRKKWKGCHLLHVLSGICHLSSTAPYAVMLWKMLCWQASAVLKASVTNVCVYA